MKLISHSSDQPEKKMTKDKDKNPEEKKKQPKVSKEEQEKQGRYWGFIILLVTIILAVIIQIF